ncbi:MAG: hypothetical protein ACI9N9_002313, partial [Enterobacterales bacterium]
MNNNNDRSTKEDKPKIVLNELEGLKKFLGANDASSSAAIPELDEMIPMLNETIPVLEQQIPELTVEVDIPDNIKVSFDSENSTETVEQQLIRTHHEQKAAPFELLSEIESSSEDRDINTNETVSEHTDLTFSLVESNAEPVPTDSLVQQQYELEQDAQQQRSTLTELTTPDDTTEAILENAWVK